jgi:hypothetical protein
MDNKDNFIVSKLFERPEHGGQNPEGKSEIPRLKPTIAAVVRQPIFVHGQSLVQDVSETRPLTSIKG